MKVIDKIRNFVKPKPKNKGKVLIRSKFGLPTVRVCGTVLVDNSAAAAAGTDFTSVTAAETQTVASSASLTNAGLSYDAATSSMSTGVSATQAVGSTGPIAFIPKIGDKIENIHLKNNEDARELIVNLNGVVSIEFGKANEQYEAIRVSYSALSLDLNALIKIYSFTSGDKVIFAKDPEHKKKYLDILNSMNISSVDVSDLVRFE